SVTIIVGIGVIYILIMQYKNQKTFTVPFFHNGRFYNNPGEKRSYSIFLSIFILLKSFFSKPISRQDAIYVTPLSSSKELNITWLGHSTLLIQVGGINILTDPIFDDIAIFFKRLASSSINITDLPLIDFVLISHNHRDHMDF